MCVYNSTKRYAYCVDLNIDVAITSYNTRISRVLQDFYVWYCTVLTPVLRYDTDLLEYTTVPYRYCSYLYSYQHGEYCLK